MLSREKALELSEMFKVDRVIDVIYDNIGSCGECKYSEKYAGEYIICNQIKTTFPKKHFCAYFENIK